MKTAINHFKNSLNSLYDLLTGSSLKIMALQPCSIILHHNACVTTRPVNPVWIGGIGFCSRQQDIR